MNEVEIFPAAGRFVTRGQNAGADEPGRPSPAGAAGIETRHSFAFGAHYDPKNTGFGLLVAHNDENLEPGSGFDMHPHRDAEIVTWVVEGTMRHIDSLGNDAMLGPGTVQWQGAGSGIVHSEQNASTVAPARFIQVWLTPDEFGLTPGYAAAQVKLEPNQLTLVAAGSLGTAAGEAVAEPETELGPTVGEAELPLQIRQRHAELYAARLEPGGTVDLAEAPYTHLFVVSGSVLIGPGGLQAGDAARILGEGISVECVEDAEILVWQMRKTTRELLTG